MLKRLRRKKGGFTLIELMVVVVILGILAAIAIPLYGSYAKKSKCSEPVKLLGNIIGDAEIYYSQKGTYVDYVIPTDITVKAKYFKYAVTATSPTGATFTATGYEGGMVAADTIIVTVSTTAPTIWTDDGACEGVVE